MPVVNNGDIQWHAIGASMRGASHERVGLPNQDAIGWLSNDGTGNDNTAVLMVLSDGHGSPRYFRSDKGAQIAVEVTLRQFAPLLESEVKPASPLATKQMGDEQLTFSLVQHWIESVELHLQENPFTQAELDEVRQHEDENKVQMVIDNPIVAYGTTLLITLVTQSFITYLQLGDGDIITVSNTGKTSRPLPKDTRFIANETTSLCSPNAWQEFRHGEHVLTEGVPALIIMATDGYYNSFEDEGAFCKVGSDILHIARNNGIDFVSTHLEQWLRETSDAGSGDDISVGIVARKDKNRELD